MLGAAACTRPGQLADVCKLAPTEAAWTRTPAAGRIEGEAHDRDEKVPIGNLEIRIVDLDRRVRTDSEGAFRFDAVPEGRHVLVTAGSVYQARGDTLVLPPGNGMKGTLALSTRHDALTHCPLYNP